MGLDLVQSHVKLQTNRLFVGYSASSNVDRNHLTVSQGFDIAHWWLAEEAIVLPAELAYALVADFVRSACGIETVHQHSFTRGLEP